MVSIVGCLSLMRFIASWNVEYGTQSLSLCSICPCNLPRFLLFLIAFCEIVNCEGVFHWMSRDVKVHYSGCND